jgi:hypothetical protein
MRRKPFWGAVGMLLAIFGVIWSIPLVLNGRPYVYALPITSVMVVFGVLLLTWVLSEEDEYENFFKKKHIGH